MLNVIYVIASGVFLSVICLIVYGEVGAIIQRKKIRKKILENLKRQSDYSFEKTIESLVEEAKRTEQHLN